jgi:hypothetical protein
LSLLAGGRQLRIVNSKVADAAIFTCKVVNKAGEDTLDFDLQVYGKSGFPLPLVTDENKTITGESKTTAIVTLAN